MVLKGKTAVIIGASGRLGSEVALALGQAGCHCLLQYLNSREKAEQIAEQIKKLGQKALAVRADLTIENQIKEMFGQAGKLGKPQILVNCAAIFAKTPLGETSFEQAQKIMNINLTASVITSKYFAKSLKENESAGKIINIADVGGIRPWAGYVLYCSSKAALIGATKALAKELAPAVCVNAIAPGIVTWPADFDDSQKQRQLSFIPLRRIATARDITEAVIFLLENDYITGQVLCVDGGRSI
jgi:NAD(P)-dependent dehydrogenase (short-subunit alcohol dehydrogenase family)